MDAAGLGTLSPELFDMILSYLTPKDVLNLRLTERIVTSTISGSHHVSQLFFTKEVILTVQSLEHMLELMKHSAPARCLKHLTIIGIAASPHDSRYKQRLGQHRDLLAEAFQSLVSAGRSGLQTLQLSLVPTEAADKKWEAVWRAAAYTFNVAIQAVNIAGIRVEELNIYEDLRLCSLGYNNLDLLDQLHCKEDLKALTISLADSQIPEKSPDDWHPQVWHSEQAIRHFTTIVATMPELKTLHMHWFDVYKPKSTPRNRRRVPVPTDDEIIEAWTARLNCQPEQLKINRALEGKTIHHVCYRATGANGYIVLPELPEPIRPPVTRLLRSIATPARRTMTESLDVEKCSIRGFSCAAEDLTKLLQTVNAKDLKLERVRLTDSWKTVFQSILPHDNVMKRLFLDDLHQDDHMLHYEIPGWSKYPCDNDMRLGPSTLERHDEEEMTKTIAYRGARGPPMGTAAAATYLEQRTIEYGTGLRNSGFMKQNSGVVRALSDYFPETQATS